MEQLPLKDLRIDPNEYLKFEDFDIPLLFDLIPEKV